jgi:hypothetical protein
MRDSSERNQPRRNSDVHEHAWKVAKVAKGRERFTGNREARSFCKVCHWDDVEDSASTGHSSSQSVSVLDWICCPASETWHD